MSVDQWIANNMSGRGPAVLNPNQSRQRQQPPRTAPSGSQRTEKISVKIPRGAKPGQKVSGTHQGRDFSFKVPRGARPGTKVKITIPAVQQQLGHDIQQIQYRYGQPPMSQQGYMQQGYGAPPMSQHGFDQGGGQA